MNPGRPASLGALTRAAAMMNAIGVFEALRVLAEEGVGESHGHAGPLRLGEHFWVVPYTDHLSRKRAKVGPVPDPGMLPTILIPELVLLDVLPDFFRTFCQPYRYALQLSSKLSDAEKLLLESKAEQQMRRFFGMFVNDFLNAWLYRMGAESWRQIGALFSAPEAHRMQANPLAKATVSLLERLKAWPTRLPMALLKLVAVVPTLSMKGIDHGRFRWAMTKLIQSLWPHHPLTVTFPGNERSWARLHPASVTSLGLRCGRLGDDFYLGDEVLQACSVVKVVIKTSSPTVFQDLKPGDIRDAIELIGKSWLHGRYLQMSLECEFAGQLRKLPWRLGGVPTDATDDEREPEEFEDHGRLGYTTYLT